MKTESCFCPVVVTEVSTKEEKDNYIVWIPDLNKSIKGIGFTNTLNMAASFIKNITKNSKTKFSKNNDVDLCKSPYFDKGDTFGVILRVNI